MSKPPATVLARKLRQHRQRQKLSITELANRAQMPREELSRIEHGHSRNPSLDRIHALADALGVRLSALVDP